VHRRSFLICRRERRSGLAFERPVRRLVLRKDLFVKELNVPGRSSTSSVSRLTLFRHQLSMKEAWNVEEVVQIRFQGDRSDRVPTTSASDSKLRRP